ncbi:Glycosidase [Clostridium sp. DSM 8431]|uniref:alpha-amylase family glycosyl hydrolase n=1 Tax=Clostridium sp. DSM 8431 TaxID=1761781 RepID=UPI0008E9AFD0|nr:alpha-amylase family glycosyl hydrolase [Clostridium sp. DSM 8431]SFU51491.1 Glycosidase [Clostridium sp. DSM 8431]
MTEWFKDCIIYHIYPLGFCGCPKTNNEVNSVNRIKKIIEWIPHMKSMSVNAVYLGPVFESMTHGYDTKDYLKLDKRLGTNEEFKMVCSELHKNNIKIILNGVFNHVGREFWAFEDLRKNKEKSKYINWFQNIRFGNEIYKDDGFTYEGWNGHYSLVKLNIMNEEVKEYIFKCISFWIDEFAIDGLRIDAADYMDRNFFRSLRRYCEGKKKNFWLMGEVIHGDYKLWANNDMLHSVTNYECYKGIYSSHNDKNYFEIAYSINRQKGDYAIYKDIDLYNFVDNHDVNRIASTLRKKDYLENVYTLLFTMPGIPAIYYGSEWGIEGVKQKNSDDDLRISLDLNNIVSDNKNLYEHIKKLGNIRKTLKALKYGDYKQILIRNEQYVFSRCFEGEEVYILLNLSEKPSNIQFNCNKATLLDELTGEKISVLNKQVNVHLKPYKGMILR